MLGSDEQLQGGERRTKKTTKHKGTLASSPRAWGRMSCSSSFYAWGGAVTQDEEVQGGKIVVVARALIVHKQAYQEALEDAQHAHNLLQPLAVLFISRS